MHAPRRDGWPRRWVMALGVLAGLVAWPGAAPRAQEEAVKVDDRRAISNAGIYIAIETGYA